MSIKKILCTLLVLFLSAEVTFAIEEELLKHTVDISNGSNLSIIDCVAVAFQNSPKIKRQKYNLDIAKSRVGIAKAQFFPVISAGVGFYHENNSNSIYYDRKYRELPNVGVSVNQLVWDFGKTTSYIKMEEFYKIGAEYEFMDSLCATLFNVKAKYYNVLKEQALGKVAQENVDLFQKFVKNAKHQPDRTSAMVNYTQAKSNLVAAENGYKNALVDLNNAMYLDNDYSYSLKNTPTFNLKSDFTKVIPIGAFTPKKFNFDEKQALEIAYESSPDLQVLISTKKAMEQSLKFIQRTYFPELSAGVGYDYLNTNETSNSRLNVGVNLTSSLNIMELKHSIKGAHAEINIADNEINLFKKDLYFELKRAFNNVDKAERQIPIALDVLQQASGSLKIVEKQYLAGQNEVDYTSYRDAITDYTGALSKYVNAIYDYNIALIQVEMAMHYHIIDIHHKSEHAVHYHSDDLIQHLVEALDCEGKEEHNHNKKHRKNKQEKL